MAIQRDSRRGEGLSQLYALVETAKANGADPWAYLKSVFIALLLVMTVEQVEALLSWKIQTHKLYCR